MVCLGQLAYQPYQVLQAAEAEGRHRNGTRVHDRLSTLAGNKHSQDLPPLPPIHPLSLPIHPLSLPYTPFLTPGRQ